jgi:hypothetical protein
MKNNMRFSSIASAVLLLGVFATLFAGCGRKNRLDVDISSVQVKPRFAHLDEALFGIPEETFLEEFPQIFDRFARLFIVSEPDTALMMELRLFATEPRFRELYDRRVAVLGDMVVEKEAITRLLRYYRFHFPDAAIPDIYTHIVGLDLSMLPAAVVVTDTVAIISTDFFLGADFEPYRFVGIPQYKTRWMVPSQIAPEYARQLAFQRAGSPDMAETLLDQMIFQGKILYFMDAMMPKVHDTLKIRYSAEQLEWVTKNQRHVWAYLINNQMIYSSDLRHSQMMIQDAPFTAVFTELSPGRMGHWFGWQIVRSFMDRNPEVTLRELLEITDAQKILTASGYKPK